MENLSRRDREKFTREDEIISSAEKIFAQKGFEDASMDEIAKEAQFTKRTLYQYFENKEDLYFAVVLRVFKKLVSYFSEENSGKQSGYQRIQEFCMNFYKFYNENTETFRIISMIGNVRKKSTVDSKRLNDFVQYNNDMFQMVANVIADGKADGSIKGDLDPHKTALSLIFLITGFFNQLSITGHSYTANFSLNIEEFSSFTIDMVLQALENRTDKMNLEYRS